MNLKNVYKIKEEESIEGVIAQYVSLPRPDAPQDAWAKSVIDELVRRNFLSQLKRGDEVDGVFREMRDTAKQFLATIT